MAITRIYPIKQTPVAQEKMPTAQTFEGPKPMSTRVGGAQHSYLGGFAKAPALNAGHVKLGKIL